MLLMNKAVYSKSAQVFGDLNQAIARANELIEAFKCSKDFENDPRIKSAMKLVKKMDSFNEEINELVESAFRANG